MQVGFDLWLQYMDARRVEADGACRDELSAQLHLAQRRLADEAEVVEFRDAELSIALITSEERRKQMEDLKTLHTTMQQDQALAHRCSMDQQMSRTKEVVAREAERRMEVCRRALKRMLRQQLAASWNAFVATVMTRKSNREAVDKVLSTMRHRSSPSLCTVRAWSLCVMPVSVHHPVTNASVHSVHS